MMKFAIVLCFVAVVAAVSAWKAGGLSELRYPDAESRTIARKVKSQAESELNQELNEFKVIAYKTQVVAGINYFIKIKSGNNYYHIRVFKSLSGLANLHKIEAGHTATDPIEYF